MTKTYAPRVERKPMTEEQLKERACGLGLKTIAGREALRVAIENVQLLDKKQRDYGPNNINAYGLFGCVVRITDKTERFKNLKGFDSEQKKALKRLREITKLFEKEWHKLN